MRMNIEGTIGELTTLPGCTQVVVSHSVFLPPKERGNGKGGAAHVKRLEAMKELGYDLALCTVDSTNAVQRHILEKNGWVYLYGFISSKTGHNVLLMGRSLEET